MNYDFVIIGGGSAGYAAARTAVALGLRTAIIEAAKEMGGLCILRGCMPSKTLLESAHRARVIRRAEEFGLHAEGFAVSGSRIIARKRKLVEEFASYRREQLEAGKFDLIRGHASFLDPHSVQVKSEDGSNHIVSASSFLIATGSVIARPVIPGLSETGYLTSDDVLDSGHIPKSVIVLGGGAIAVELATYYRGLGVEVTLLQRSSHLLKEMDMDVSEALEAALKRSGVSVFTGTLLTHVEKAVGGKRVIFTHKHETKHVEAEEIIQCLGRIPALRDLGLSHAGLSEDGVFDVAPTQQTRCPHIFAAGDSAGPFEVVHIAIQQGEIAARNASRLVARNEEALEHTDYRLKLYVVFCDPEVAAVGVSEKEALEHRRSVSVATYPFADHGKSLCMGETEGFVKLIADNVSGKIIGGAVIGPQASELIHEIVVAVHFQTTPAQLAGIPHYHPTLSEIWTYPAEELMERLGTAIL